MIVQDLGPPDAKVVIVGESPGASEEKAGIPFCGSSGKLLKQMLSHSGINFGDCYVTNVVNVRPPDNKFEYFYVDKQCRQPSPLLEESTQRLRNKIEAIRPQVIIPLGKEALRAICNKSSVAAYRGTWLSFRGIPVLPTYHPAYIMRQYQDHVIVEMDLKKAVCNRPKELPKPILGPNFITVMNWFHNLPSNRVAFDIETVGRHVRCLGLAADGRQPISIPFIRFASSDLATVGSTVVQLSGGSQCSASYWSPQDEVRVLDLIAKLFASDTELVGHNSVMFDAPLLYDEFKLSIKNHYLDTMNAWHVLYSELPNGLDFLVSALTDYPNYWSEKLTEDDNSEWAYNAYDAQVTLELSYSIEEELKETVV